MYDLVAIGESLIDFTPAGKNESGIPMFSQNPGGAPANVLAMVSKLGGTTAFIGKVGQDDFGDFLKKNMESAGINCSEVKRDNEIPTTLAFVQLNEKGDRSFTFYRKPGADIRLEAGEVPLKLLSDCRIFHFGSVSLTEEPSRTATLFAVKNAKEQGTLISFDPNYRPFLWQSEEAAKKEILDVMPLADLVKVSDEELFLLSGTTDLEQGAKFIIELGASVVFVTLGPKGAYFKTAAGSGMQRTFDVKTIDTTGAGDAFWGALLHSVLNSSAENTNSISLDDWNQYTIFANAAGSLTTTAKGAIPAMPKKMEIADCMENVAKL